MVRQSTNRRQNTRAPARNRRTTAASSSSSALGYAGAGSALGLLAGATAGAAIMFLFDPSRGSQRRHDLVSRAGNAVHGMSDTASGALHGMSDRASGALQGLGGMVSSAMHSAGGRASDAGASLASHVPDTDDLRSRGMNAIQSARQRLAGVISGDHSTHVSPIATGATGLVALAAGLGAMWLFDPDRGRGRRAWIGQKVTRAINETGHFMSATGRHVRNRVSGYYHDTASVAREMMDAEAGDPDESAT